MFTPMKIAKGPKSGDEGMYRHTYGAYTNGNAFQVVELWKEISDPHRMMDQAFIGITRFSDSADLSNQQLCDAQALVARERGGVHRNAPGCPM